MAEIYGKVTKKEGRKVWIVLDKDTPDFKLDNALLLQKNSVALFVDDGIMTTPQQRKFAHVLMKEILDAGIGGYNPRDFGGWLINVDTVKAHFKEVFFIRYGKQFTFKIGKSLKKDAEYFIEILMEYIDEHGIMIEGYEPLEYLSDAGRYDHCYRSLMKSTCAVCGKRGQLHHLEGSKIGNGNDRRKVNHIGRWAVELCSKHHDIMHHNEKRYFEEWHLLPVKIDDLIAAKHNLNAKNGNDERLRSEYEQ